MAEYRIEAYHKGAKKPYNVFTASLENRSRPTFTRYEECFGGKLDRLERVKIKRKCNGGLVAEKYIDAKGRGRLRWYREF